MFEDEEKFKLTDIMEFHFIEMTKLIREWKEDHLNPWDDLLARWLLLLGIVDHRKGKIYDDIFKELEEIAMKDETLRTAFQSWEELSGTQEEVLAYQARLKKVLDEEAALREAELREARAWEEGREKGVEEGMEKERKEIARRLLANKTDVKTVAKITALPEERVLEIQKEMGE